MAPLGATSVRCAWVLVGSLLLTGVPASASAEGAQPTEAELLARISGAWERPSKLTFSDAEAMLADLAEGNPLDGASGWELALFLREVQGTPQALAFAGAVVARFAAPTADSVAGPVKDLIRSALAGAVTKLEDALCLGGSGVDEACPHPPQGLGTFYAEVTTDQGCTSGWAYTGSCWTDTSIDALAVASVDRAGQRRVTWVHTPMSFEVRLSWTTSYHCPWGWGWCVVVRNYTTTVEPTDRVLATGLHYGVAVPALAGAFATAPQRDQAGLEAARAAHITFLAPREASSAPPVGGLPLPISHGPGDAPDASPTPTALGLQEGCAAFGPRVASCPAKSDWPAPLDALADVPGVGGPYTAVRDAYDDLPVRVRDFGVLPGDGTGPMVVWKASQLRSWNSNVATVGLVLRLAPPPSAGLPTPPASLPEVPASLYYDVGGEHVAGGAGNIWTLDFGLSHAPEV